MAALTMLTPTGVLGLASAAAHPLGRTALPALSVADVSQAEGSGGGWTPFVFTVSLSSASSSKITVHYRVTPGSADGHDLKLGKSKLSIPAGATAATIAVRVRADNVPEPDETFFVTLLNPKGATIGDGSAQGTILNDDGPAPPSTLPTLSIDNPSVVEGNTGTTPLVFTVTLTPASADPVVVHYHTREGTATGSDFHSASGALTFAPGETVKPITVEVIGDTIPEPNETLVMVLDDPSGATIASPPGTGTIVNDDAPALSIGDVSVLEGNSGTTSAVFTVHLSTPAPAGGVTFDIATANGSAAAGSDYQSSSASGAIPAGSSDYSFPVPIFGDTSPEPDETFFVNVTSVVGATVADGQATGTIVNDDGPGSGTVPTLSIDSVSLAEGNTGTTPFVFTVTLSAPVGHKVRVDYATADGTATSGLDFGSTSGTLVIPSGQTSGQISVLVTGDTDPEPDETFFVNLSNPDRATIAQGQGVGTIVNDDGHPPTADDQNVSTDVDTAKTITLTGGDPDGDPISFSIVSNPMHGSLGSIGTVSCSGNPSSCSADVGYTPASGYHGPDSFTFKTNDGHSDSTVDGTVSITVNAVPPVAVDDSYTATGNVPIDVSDTAEGVLQRGTDDTLYGATITNCGPANTTTVAVSSGICTTSSADGGSIVLSTDGTFTYEPPAGFTGDDTFYYKLTNSGGSSVGKVTVTVSDMIWFFDASNSVAGDGRLSSPFKAVSSFTNDGTTGHGQNGQTLFVATGTYTSGLTLRNGQILIGQGASASIATISGITLAPFSAALPSTGGTAPSLTTSSGNAITLGSGNTVRGLNVGNTAGTGISGSSFGTLALSEVTVSGSGQALSLSSGTANATFGSVSSSSGTNGISLTSVAGTLGFGTGGSLTGSTGDELVVTGGSNTWTYPGSITKSGTGKAVNVTGRTGGTVTLSGAITDTGGSGSGVYLHGNTGGTVTLSGGVTLSTGSNAALTATGGGTVNVTGSSNTLTTTTGKALDVESTTIGSSGLTFRSISSNGAASGIVLSSTGTTGGLTVTGNSSGICGGSVTNTTTPGTAATVTAPNTADCTGGTILGSTGVGISISNAGTVSLTRMEVSNSGTDGIAVSSATGFTLDHGYVTDSTGLITDDGVRLTNVSGTVTISNSTLKGGPLNNLAADNDNVDMTAFNVTGSVLRDNTGVPTNGIANDGILLTMRGTSALTSGQISDSAFTGINATGAQILTNDSGRIGSASGGSISSGFTVQDSSFTNTNVGLDISQSQVSSEAFEVLTNTFQNLHSHAINVFTAAGSDTGPASHYQVGKIDGNVIGIQGTKDSGSVVGNGIRVVIQGQTTQGIVTLSNNTIHEVVNADVINLIGQDGAATTTTGSAKFKVVNNLMPTPSGSTQSFCGPANTPCALSGISVLADEDMPVCSVISENSIYDVTSMNGTYDVYLAERSGPPTGAQLTVEGTGGSNASYIQANNTLSGADPFFDEGSNTSQVGPGTCGTFP